MVISRVYVCVSVLKKRPRACGIIGKTPYLHRVKDERVPAAFFINEWVLNCGAIRLKSLLFYCLCLAPPHVSSHVYFMCMQLMRIHDAHVSSSIHLSRDRLEQRRCRTGGDREHATRTKVCKQPTISKIKIQIKASIITWMLFKKIWEPGCRHLLPFQALTHQGCNWKYKGRA